MPVRMSESDSPVTLFPAKSSPIAVGGPLIVWLDAFTPAELDRIEAYGDGRAPMRAELARRSDIPDHKRSTRVAWMERTAQTEWLYARLQEIVLRLNTEFYKYDLYGLIEAFQYTVYEGSEGGHYNWHVDLDRKSTRLNSSH